MACSATIVLIKRKFSQSGSEYRRPNSSEAWFNTEVCMRQMNFRRNFAVLLLGCFSCTSVALAQASTQSQIQDTGISGLWVLANISFAGIMSVQRVRTVLECVASRRK